MNAILSLAFVFVAFAIGDIISAKTKSIVSTMFTCSVIFIVGFFLGVPQTLFEDANLQGIGALLITSILAHMGTMMSLKQLKMQWKTVLIACAAVVGITVLMLLVGPLVLGKTEAMVAAPVLSGGIIASLMMQESVAVAGLSNGETLAVFATVLMVMEGFVGYPVASFVLKREGMQIKKQILAGTFVPEDKKLAGEEAKKKLIPPLPESLDSENIYLAKVALVGLLATWVASLITQVTGSTLIDKNILALIFGIIFAELGFLEHDVLGKAKSSGFAMAALMAVIFASLAKATPEMLMELLPVIIGANILGVIGYGVFAIIMGKIIKVSPWICIAIGSTANYGFPGTYIISKEVAKSLGDTPEMTETILDAIMPKMLVGGFVTVSIASVLIASLVAWMF